MRTSAIQTESRRARALSTPQFPAAVRGDAGRGGGQYGAPVGDAGDRPGDRRSPICGSRLAYTWSAVLWVALAPFWAAKSDRHGRKALTLLGLGGFIVVDDPVRARPGCRAQGAGSAVPRRSPCSPCSAPFTARSAAPRHPRPRPISPRAPAARRACHGAVRWPRQLRPRHHPRPGDRALVRASPAIGLPGPFFAFALIGAATFAAIARLAARRQPPAPRPPRRARRGDELSLDRLARPGQASSPPPRRTARPGSDGATRGSAAGSSPESPPAMPRRRSLTCLGFFVIDRLGLAPIGSEGPIAIVHDGRRSGRRLAAQWGLIPRSELAPRAVDRRRAR